MLVTLSQSPNATPSPIPLESGNMCDHTLALSCAMVVCKCARVYGCVSWHYVLVLRAHQKQQRVTIFALFGVIETHVIANIVPENHCVHSRCAMYHTMSK